MPTATATTPATTDAPVYPVRVVKLAAYLLATTTKHFGKFLGLDEAAKPLSEKALAVQKAISSHMSRDHRHHAAALFSILLGEDIAVSSSEGFPSSIYAGCIFVPTANPNGHNYTVGQVHITPESGYWAWYRMKRKDTGNNPPKTRGDFRLPTEAEAQAYCNEYYSEIVSLLNLMVVE